MVAVRLLPFVALAVASPLFNRAPIIKPAAFFLAGDSTTATQSSDGGGWGNGFLTTLTNGALGINYGHNGATTVSFVNGGDWAKVLASVTKYKAAFAPYVTIQFGHNDQKDAAITLDDYKANLGKMCTDVKSAGGTPVLVTPITRRAYNDSGLVIQNLDVQAAATLQVAASVGVPSIDLNKASTAYVDAIGKTDAWQYNLIPTDTTHLNAMGSILFGNIVASLLQKSSVATLVNPYLAPNMTILEDVKAGTFILPANQTLATNVTTT